ncbi:hypothetical protein ACFZA2_17220 [Microbacterium sp. NPDC007973]|uniref:hypothetical protein n=1 Tax=Microbacterium sp. NPDC007973 TaxID=3364182 RepID=UPI0036E3B8D7
MAEDDDTQQSPFARPGFIVGAVVVAALLITAVFLTVLNLNRGNDAAPPEGNPSSSSSASAAPTPSESAVAGGVSVCGLDGVELSGRVTTPPTAEWAYVRTVAYPTSKTYGPAATTSEGVPTCFQHSPTGALFAAATALAVPADPTLARAWIETALSSGTYRDKLLAEANTGSETSGVRLQLVGFKVLSYDGKTASIDLAVRGSTEGQTVTGSAVYALVWEDGDWKIDANNPAPFDFASIPDTSGYIAWGA